MESKTPSSWPVPHGSMVADDKKNEVRLRFDHAEFMEHFIAWFLDGGGEYDFGEYLDFHVEYEEEE